MAIKDTDRKARANYKKKVKKFAVEFYPTETDVYEFLQKQQNKQGLIKELIRNEMNKSGE